MLMGLDTVSSVTSGPTTIFTASLTSGDDTYNTYTTRTIEAVTGNAQTQVRVTLTASAGLGGFSCNNVSIGIANPVDTTSGDTTATPVELLFSGSSGCSASQGTTVTSDWLNFNGFTTSDKLIIICDFGSTGGLRYLSGTGQTRYKIATASYNVQTVSASSYNNFGGTLIVSKIETQ